VRAATNGVLAFLGWDGANDPDDLMLVTAPVLERAADLVVGVRRQREPGSMTPFQRLGNLMATDLIGRMDRVQVSDLAPMRAIRLDKLLALEPAAQTYGWSTEMTVTLR
jgi:hypothetical protein